jgi:hypothetical protein
MKRGEGSDEGLVREFDFSRAIRGRFAYLWSPEQREEYLRHPPFADEENWREFVRRALDLLSAALFAYLVLVDGEAPRRALIRSDALDGGTPRRRPGVADPLAARLAALRAEREWIPTPRPDHDRVESLAWVERMGRFLTDAGSLREALEEEVRRHLAGGGLTPGEIERRTEEAARLWRAA